MLGKVDVPEVGPKDPSCCGGVRRVRGPGADRRPAHLCHAGRQGRKHDGWQDRAVAVPDRGAAGVRSLRGFRDPVRSAGRSCRDKTTGLHQDRRISCARPTVASGLGAGARTTQTMKTRTFLTLTALLLAPLAALHAADAPPASLARDSGPAVNLLQNPSFEEKAGDGVEGWMSRAWAGKEATRWSVATPGRTGERCVSIASDRWRRRRLDGDGECSTGRLVPALGMDQDQGGARGRRRPAEHPEHAGESGRARCRGHGTGRASRRCSRPRSPGSKSTASSAVGDRRPARPGTTTWSWSTSPNRPMKRGPS